MPKNALQGMYKTGAQALQIELSNRHVQSSKNTDSIRIKEYNVGIKDH